MLGRAALVGILVLAGYYLLPMDRPGVTGTSVLAVGLLLTAGVLAWHVRAIMNSPFPRLRWPAWATRGHQGDGPDDAEGDGHDEKAGGTVQGGTGRRDPLRRLGRKQGQQAGPDDHRVDAVPLDREVLGGAQTILDLRREAARSSAAGQEAGR
jgi:hypothetical protein